MLYPAELWARRDLLSRCCRLGKPSVAIRQITALPLPAFVQQLSQPRESTEKAEPHAKGKAVENAFRGRAVHVRFKNSRHLASAAEHLAVLIGQHAAVRPIAIGSSL